MSHFSVLVIGTDVEGQLAPYHEYECSGINDKYVQDIDKTHEIQELADKIDEKTGEPHGLQYALNYHGLADKVVDSEAKVRKHGKGRHAYGYAIVQDGKLLKAIDRTNPNKKWDWYVIGGRWGGFFRLKPGTTGTLGKPSTFDIIDGDQRDHSKVDQAAKGDIDFAAMRGEAAAKAAERYDHFAEVTKGCPWPELWETVQSRFKDNIDEARKVYWAQPLCAAMKTDDKLAWEWDGPERFGPNRAQYIEREARSAAHPFAVIKNGVWYEKGSMGWFGSVLNEQDGEQWAWQCEQLIDGLPDDTLLTLVDCHI